MESVVFFWFVVFEFWHQLYLLILIFTCCLQYVFQCFTHW